MATMFVSSMYHLESHEFHVAEIFLCFVPFLSVVTYFLPVKTMVDSLSHGGYHSEGERRPFLHKIALLSVVLLLITYVVEPIVLLFSSAQQNVRLAEDIVRSLDRFSFFRPQLSGSMVFWTAVTLDFPKRAHIPSISLGGCSGLYMTTEVFLLATSAQLERQEKSSAIMAIRVLRLVLAGVLLSIAGATYMVPYQQRNVEEESEPLLPDGTAGRDPVHRSSDRGITYGAIIQRIGPSQTDAWPGQVRIRPPITRISSRRLQPIPSLQNIQEEAQIDEDDVTENTRPQGSIEEAPALRVAKLRRKRKESTSKHQDRQRKKNLQISEDPSKVDLEDISSRKTAWKPDAPEFVPNSYRRQQARQANEGRNDEFEFPHTAGKGQMLAVGQDQVLIAARKTDTSTTMEESVRPSVTNENREFKPKTSKTSKTGLEYAIERDRDQSASVLQQATNGVIYAYPKKTRKRGKGSRREIDIRRKRTESEPAGIGLDPHLNLL